MTEVSILNDRWDEIRKNPKEFVEQLHNASMDLFYAQSNYIIGQTTVARTHHADDLRVYFAARNAFFEAYPESGMTLDSLKRHLKYLSEMKRHIKVSEEATKKAIEKGE
jgi:hypothetical protein